jgi:hypothetical protein
VTKAIGRPGAAARVRRHDDKEGVLAHGQESLGAVRVALDHLEGWAGPGLGPEDADARPAVREVEPRAVVKPPAQTLVDELVGRTASLQHIAERREGLRGQRLVSVSGRSSAQFLAQAQFGDALDLAQASANSVSRSWRCGAGRRSRIDRLGVVAHRDDEGEAELRRVGGR